MNWVKENKFVAGLLLVNLIGGGGLAFLLLGARQNYEAAIATYQEQASELGRLQKAQIFPSQKNLDKLNEQKKQATAEAGELIKALAAQQVPAEELSPAAFQDKLKDAVSAFTTKANQNGVKYPEKFFLGFDKYETAPPDAAAAVALGRQLKVIDWVVGKIVESRAAEIKSLDRPELTEEKGAAKVDDKKAPAGRTDKAGKVSVRKNPFEIVFLADLANFRQILNAIQRYQGQFLVPRLVVVKNEKDKGPARVLAGVPGVDVPVPPADGVPPATNPDGTPLPPGAAPTGPASSTYIVGEEKVEVRLVLEAVDFTDAGTKDVAAK